MLSGRRGFLAFTLIAVVASLSMGCASTQITRCGGGLTRQQLEAGGLAIGGVTALGGGEFVATDAAVGQVEQRLRQARPWLKIVPWARVREGFANGDYELTLKHLSEIEDWRPQDVVPFRWLTNACRYLILVNIFHTNERHRTREVHGFAQSLLDYMFGGPDSEGDDYEVKSVTRKVEVIFCIFDLEREKLIWLASGLAKLKSAYAFPIDGSGSSAEGSPPPSLLDAIDPLVKRMAARLPR